jgi:N-acetylmuramic acid 6-phosphate etherase
MQQSEPPRATRIATADKRSPVTEPSTRRRPPAGGVSASAPEPAGPAALTTEVPSECHPDLDQYSVEALVDSFVDDQVHALGAVKAARGRIAAAVHAAVPRIAAGGRLVYVGAGTSGRLGVLDSVELFPTFSWPRERAVALLAGGPQAMFESIEGAEDSAEQGRRDLEAAAVTRADVVILLAASGTTPYVVGALEAARAAGALTIGIANNPAAPVTLGAEIAITLNTGSEVISGSTRLKAGTSQKIALNTLSSAIMVKLNKVYGNLMVDLQATNTKLLRRAESLTMRATGADEDTVRRTLASCNYRVKVAIVAILNKTDVAAAAARLDAADGSVRLAISE